MFRPSRPVSRTPSPFSASLLFGYVANYLYDGDAPLAERRAQALSVDQSQLRDLIGDTELRDRHLDCLQALHPELPFLRDFLSAVDITSVLSLKR